MFKKVLVANRGEIAVQIIRNLRELGVRSVAVYSTADRDAYFTQIADEAVCIGGPLPADSYLNMKEIISTACLTGSDAIHPGYGFLSENAQFAQMCAECDLTFIGPASNVIEQMGDKASARAVMKAAGVPVIPGSSAVLSDVLPWDCLMDDVNVWLKARSVTATLSARRLPRSGVIITILRRGRRLPTQLRARRLRNRTA